MGTSEERIMPSGGRERRRNSAPSSDETWWQNTSVAAGADNRDERPQEPNVLRPAVGNNQTIICATIAKPPTFREDHFGDYKRPINWWMQLQHGIDPGRLLAAIGAYEQGPVKWILNDYFSSAKNDASSRVMEGFMAMMDTRFKRSTDDLVLNKLAQWNDIKRKKGRAFECSG